MLLKQITLKVCKRWCVRIVQLFNVWIKATVDIETEKLKYLCDIAEKYHGASKTSGAGGGDCGITIINKDVDKEKFMMNGQNMVLNH